MMDLIAGIAIGMVIAAGAGYFALKIAARRAEEDLARLFHVIDKLKETMISARVEEHDGVFYIYNTEDDSFMAQGSTISELRERIEQRWKDAQVFVNEGDQSVIDRLRATSHQESAEQ